jgi:predicted RNase H-like nuclease
MSRQTVGIRPKILEVDHVMTPPLQQLIYEGHPELAFAALRGRPMQFNKKTKRGRSERLRTLERHTKGLFRGISRRLLQVLAISSRRQLAADDLIDAAVLAWTARRIYAKTAGRLPKEPTVDQKGLRMEIWY